MRIEKQVIQIIMEQLGVREKDVTKESVLRDDLGADSLDEIELVMAIEDEFSIEIPEEESENIKTVRDVIDYVTKRKA